MVAHNQPSKLDIVKQDYDYFVTLTQRVSFQTSEVVYSKYASSYFVDSFPTYLA